jgi:mannosyl-oligosaccharide alpha-1,2-mannosidase
MNPTGEDVLIAGAVRSDGRGKVDLEPEGQHLACFLGGLFALGGKLFGRPRDLETAVGLVNGCIWAYKSFPSGIMAETFLTVPCNKSSPDGRAAEDPPCQWDELAWKREVLRLAGKETADMDAEKLSAAADKVIETHRLPKGFSRLTDKRYILRPEAIESVFILYRTTGAEELLDVAWDMFSAIEKATATQLANSEVTDVTADKPRFADSMESFWLGETLKYFYLIFSEPDLISLDEFVFNTEAHPLRRMLP